MDILGRFPKSQLGTRFVVVITDRFSKLARAVPMNKAAAAHVAQIFPDAWVVFVWNNQAPPDQ